MPSPLQFVKSQKVSLKDHPEFDEAWLRDMISNDPGMLGLGDLVLKETERMQPKAGRLDLLFQDDEDDKRYEVELMLGKVDETHIIRCLEYWDIERRRLPSFDHCAVLVAEEITARFLNVISLFNGAIPIVALQLNAIQVGNQIVLSFTKVLDEASPITAEEEEEELSDREVTNRDYWEEKGSQLALTLADECLELLRTIDSSLSLTYNKQYIGLKQGNRPNNFVVFKGKKNFLRVEPRLDDVETAKKQLESAGIAVIGVGRKRLRFMIKKGEITAREDAIKTVFARAYKESME
jgi:hypothetical protein